MTDTTIVPFPFTEEMRKRHAEIEAAKFDARMDAEITEIHAEVLQKEKEKYGTNDLYEIGKQIMYGYSLLRSPKFDVVNYAGIA